MSDPDRDLMLTELLEQWHEGSLSESARDEFQRRLLAEPALRQEVRVAAHMHQFLSDWFDAGSTKRTAAAVEMLLDGDQASERQRLIRAVEQDLRPRGQPGRSTRHRLFSGWGAAAAAASVAFVIGLWFLLPTNSIVDDQGRRLASGSTVGGPTSQSLHWSDGSSVALSAGSRGRLAGDVQHKRVELQAGQVSAEIAPQGSGTFVVASPHGEVTVVGTRFRVITFDRATTVSVEHGSVQIQAQNEQRMLATGEAARMSDGKIDLLPALTAPHQDLLEKYPPVLTWTDRRPIGMFILGQQGTYSPSNPNGWFDDASLDVHTTDGQTEFRRRLMAKVDVAITQLRSMHAQGVIWWNPEGNRWLNRLGYVGDATRLNELSPETDRVADEVMARFAAAGLRTGVVVRPWVFTGTAEDLRISEDLARMPELLLQRITYAQRRWGCTLFPLMQAYTGWSGPKLSTEQLTAVAAAVPQVLIIPDHQRLEDRSVAAGWTTTRRLLSEEEGAGDDLANRLYPGSPQLLHIEQTFVQVAIPAAVLSHLGHGGVALIPVPADGDEAMQRLGERLGK